MATTNPSYVHGGCIEQLKYLTISHARDQDVERWGDRKALVARHQNLRWTFSELNEAADSLATGLLSLGLEPGDRVGIWSPNKVEWVVTQFATAKAGLILVNINPAYRIGELEYALNKVECKSIVIAEQFKTSNYVEMLNKLAPELKQCAAGALEARAHQQRVRDGERGQARRRAVRLAALRRARARGARAAAQVRARRAAAATSLQRRSSSSISGNPARTSSPLASRRFRRWVKGRGSRGQRSVARM